MRSEYDNISQTQRQTQMGLQLPDNVTAKRTTISPTSFEYTFQHSELGELGSVLFCAMLTGRCHVTHQVCMASVEELSEQRRQIFEPLAKAMAAHLNAHA